MGTAAERVGNAIEAISARPQGMTVSQLARDLGISVTAASRLMSSLIDAHLVATTDEPSCYVLGSRFWAWGIRATREMAAVFEIARPALLEGANQTGALMVLSFIRDSGTVYYVAISSIGGVTSTINQDYIVPLHACAPGKAMLAFQPLEDIEDALRRPLTRFTNETLTDADRLREELRQIRAQGYSTSRGEFILENAAVAAPILNSDGRAVAAVSSPGLDEAFSQLETILPVIRRVASTVSLALGYPGVVNVIVG